MPIMLIISEWCISFILSDIDLTSFIYFLAYLMEDYIDSETNFPELNEHNTFTKFAQLQS